MPLRRSWSPVALALAAAAALVARPLAAQIGTPPPDSSPHTAPHTQPHTAPHVDPHIAPHALPQQVQPAAEAPSTLPTAGGASAHLRLTPARRRAAGDSGRAVEIERALLAYLARYADVRDAERDGYERYLRGVRQPVYHYTSRRHAVRAAFDFDPARPTSLLYRDEGRGRLVLVGAMYTTPARASMDELDRRVPLSVARWHQHVDICVPPRHEPSRWLETDIGRPRFGPTGTIDTREACHAVGGRFHERIYGWMVHADLVATPHGPRVSWAGKHEGH